MSETANSDGTSAESEMKPALLARLLNDEVKFPPFPDPTEEEFEEDIGDDERTYYRNKFTDLNTVKTMRLHCTACDRHLGSSTRNESRMRAHPMLRTVVCQSCHTFYNSGEFEKGDDGSELYCRWCGQGGQVYCCSDCPHVFCAKCIKRNFGNAKIKEIENTDDWKCFKCNSKCLWDLRAVCWALLRYCDLKNKMTYKTEDPALKEVYQKDCAVDYTECCKHKASRKKEKLDTSKKKEEPKKKEELKKKEEPKKPVASVIIPKMSSAIQVKKFASINIEEPVKKATKRPANDNKVVMMRNPISIAPPKSMGPIVIPPPHKKPRMPMVNPIRFVQDRKPMNTYQRIRPKINVMPSMPIPIMPHQFNGFNNNAFHNYGNMDTLNLSLDSLTQGLDMVAVAAMNNSVQDDDVVCTPDFPLEPLCEVTEDNTDDDVQCITPAAGPAPPPLHPLPPAVSRLDNTLPDLSHDNIVQMTDNDVTVNALTGGLKFRVDPQTLSSNKMYRLPDGRIFAIKANPNMPGGYSATIVAVTETGQAKVAPKGATFAAKLSAVCSSQTSTPKPGPSNASPTSRPGLGMKRSTPKHAQITKVTETPSRECDLQVPIEWFRYNLVDAVDALEYSLHRLYKLKKEANCRFLRSRSIDEMRNLHRSLDRLLNTSSTRFNEIKDNLSKDFRQFLSKKKGETLSDDDDDDVEILADNIDENDDPIFIDENSLESSNDLTCTEPENPEVDLTGVGSSDHNDSGENKSDDVSKIDKDEIADVNVSPNTENSKVFEDGTMNDTDKLMEIQDEEVVSSDQDNKNDIARTEDAQNSETDQENAAVDSKKDKINDAVDKAGEKNEYNNEQVNEDNNEKDNEDNNEKDNEENNEKDNEDNNEKDNEDNNEKDNEDSNENNEDSENLEKDTEIEKKTKTKVNGDTEQDKSNDNTNNDENLGNDEKSILADDINSQDNDGKLEDTEMSEEMIETLLKDDNVDDVDSLLNKKASEVVEAL